jgi:hypothetical protein
VSATTYKINLNFTESSAGSSSNIGGYTMWISNNGSLVAAYVSFNGSGENITGSEASGLTAGIFAGFLTEVASNQDLGVSTASNYFHSSGNSQVKIGSNTLTVTNYVANSLPVTITNCDGTTSSLTACALSVGTPSGATGPLITYAHFAGTTNNGDGTTSTFNEVITVTSYTLG